MPSDYVILTGDKAIFNPSFPPATVAVQPGIITGTGRSKSVGPIVCIQGDEASVVVPGCAYFTPTHAGGIGTLTITALNPDQIAKQTKFTDKPAILKGTLFTAKFTVTAPAPFSGGTGPPDPVPFYVGNGQFQTTNIKLKGT
jgi:Contractile injection system spike tip protein